ncbi:MAG TPA: 4-alpha-glucanotransferase [Woeseiaceae bacterium]|nr:4-alpha-glucanotransferase [Woeseiaceae bacterium]
MSPLHALAREAGLLVEWQDAAGRRQRVSDDSLVAVLTALQLQAATPEQIEESRRRIREDEREAAQSLVTVDAGQPVRLPERAEPVRFDEPGYHEVETDRGSVTVAVAPPRAWTVANAAPGRRIWAPAVQIPALRDARGEAFGDFGALARFARAAGGNGADALAMSPVHALFPADASRYSPYGPSSRLFLNVLLADSSLLGDEGGEAAPGELIDWRTAIPQKLARLRALFQRRDDATHRAVAEFARERGEPLLRHAAFDALHAHFFERIPGGWQGWPAAYHDAAGSAVAEFVAGHREDIDFHVFLQWLAERGLQAAQAAAQDAGMAVGLIADMAVGLDAGGSEAWSRPGRLLEALSVGAPPDPLGPDGQDWGITTFSPRALRRHGFESFIETIRTAVRHAGGIRLDHAMSLQRLWVIPRGARAGDGAYLTYPERDLVRLLALEAWRARAIVIGEDLGTVPPGFRARMAKRGLLGMRVLWFERTRGGRFTPPARWPREAVAMTSTHDLPTVAGWWQGRDIDWTWKLNRGSDFPTEEAEHAARAKDRTRFWQAHRRAATHDRAPPYHGAATHDGTPTHHGAANTPPAGARHGGRPEPGPPEPREPTKAVDAAVEFVASTPSALAIFPVEDLLALPEQPNLPGTVNEHPNWRRRLPVPVEEMLDAPGVSTRIECLNEARRS